MATELGELRDLPFHEGAFDCVLAYRSIYHCDFAALVDSVGEALRVLAPGGELYAVSCPGVPYYRSGEGSAPAPVSAADPRVIDNFLAQVACRVGDYVQAARLCGKAEVADPSLWNLLLEIALHNGRSADVERLSKAIEQAAGQGTHWHYAEAVYFTLLAKEGKPQFLASAAEHLAKAWELAPTQPRVPLLAAQIEARTRPALATAHYIEAVALGESNPVVIGDVMDHLDRHQRYLEADRVIRRLISRPSMLLATLSGGELQPSLPPDDLAQAERAARQVAATGEKGVRNLLCKAPEGPFRQKVPDPFSSQVWLGACWKSWDGRRKRKAAPRRLSRC